MPDNSSKLPFPPTVAQLYARALWDPKPTKTMKSQKQLAYALGYPVGWRVERVVTTQDDKKTIRDRIHAVGKNKSKYTWFHHEAAQLAAVQLEQEGTMEGSHLLPPMPLYTKGDIVQVNYEGKWYDATITKRKKVADDFLYSVQYDEEDATQDEVTEDEIRPAQDPSVLAMELGFSEDWKASRKGSRYIITAPTGERFTTKKAAMKFLQEQAAAQSDEDDVGDPPWRTKGHEWIGRQVQWSSLHRVSGTRKIKVDQIGTITGFIHENDVDKHGNPGFISDLSGKPAKLFHVTFPDDPHHPYSAHLINSQDLEVHEVDEVLLEETEKQKRNREQEAKAATLSKGRKRRRR